MAPVLVACSIPSSWHHPAPRLALLWRLAGCLLRHQRVPGAALVGVGSHSDPCRLPDTEAKRGPASCGSSPLAPKPQTHVDLGHRPPPRCPFPTTVECPRETFESGPPVVAVMLRARQPQLECPEQLRRVASSVCLPETQRSTSSGCNGFLPSVSGSWERSGEGCVKWRRTFVSSRVQAAERVPHPGGNLMPTHGPAAIACRCSISFDADTIADAAGECSVPNAPPRRWTWPPWACQLPLKRADSPSLPKKLPTPPRPECVTGAFPF